MRISDWSSDVCSSDLIHRRTERLLPHRRRRARTIAMLNIGSLIIGAIALVLAVFAFIPLLGWANWVIIPFAVIGLALGAMSDKTRSEEHTSELQSLMRISYAVFCLKKKKTQTQLYI